MFHSGDRTLHLGSLRREIIHHVSTLDGLRLVSVRGVVYRLAHSRGVARTEFTRGYSMSDQPTTDHGHNHVSRRTFLRAAAVTGAVAVSPPVLRGSAEAQETPSPIKPDPAAKHGGTLRYGILSAAAHFDVH